MTGTAGPTYLRTVVDCGTHFDTVETTQGEYDPSETAEEAVARHFAAVDAAKAGC